MAHFHAHHHDHAGHDHAGHGHGHVDPRRALVITLGLNGVFLLAEAAAGWWTGSLALLSDAAHMLSDVSALVLALAAAQLATGRADANRTYGLARAEVLGAFVNSALLLAACAWIVYEAVLRLTGEPPHVPGVPVLAVGVLGLAVNLGSAWALARSDAENLNVRGALLHMLADALGSVAAIVAALLLMLGVPGADAAASLAVAALVTFGAVRLLREAGRVLLELPPPGLDVTQVRDALLAVDGVVEVHDLHAWSLDGRTPMVSAHLVLEEEASFETVCRAAHSLLEDRFRVAHATVQPERGRLCGTRCGVEAGGV